MKILLIDVGNFYTKVYVKHPVTVSGARERIDQTCKFYGRCFFPTLVSRVSDINDGRMYYEHGENLYAVGYDCISVMRFEQIMHAFDSGGFNAGNALIILKKIIFDYADNNDDLEITVVADSYEMEQGFKEIGEALCNKKVVISAFRGQDKRFIKKEVTIKLSVLSVGDAVVGFLEKNKMCLTTSLVVDIGYSKTKLYMVDSVSGVDTFQIENCGVSFYYEKISKLFAEENIDVDDHNFLWLVKQIELGCEDVEVRTESKGQIKGNVTPLFNPSPRHYDISLVMENVRWDINKEFQRFTADMLEAFYTKRLEWPAMLVVTGGGASLNGDILRFSLEEDGYIFSDVYIEKLPIYTMLEGADYILSEPYAQ